MCDRSVALDATGWSHLPKRLSDFMRVVAVAWDLLIDDQQSLSLTFPQPPDCVKPQKALKRDGERLIFGWSWTLGLVHTPDQKKVVNCALEAFFADKEVLAIPPKRRREGETESWRKEKG